MELHIFTEGNTPPPELLRACTQAIDAEQYDPCCCAPAWQLSFHESFLPQRTLLIGAEDGRAALFAEGAFENGMPCLTPLESHWFSGAPLLGPDQDELFAGLVSAVVRAYGGCVPGFMLSALPREVMKRIAQRFGPYFRFALYTTAEQRSASLEGGMDGFLSRRSGNFRSKMKKARRRADALGVEYEHAVPSSLEEADAIYARMLDVESRSWKGMAGSGISESPSREFYHYMMRRLAVGPQAGNARVIFATHEGVDVGFIFGSLSCGGPSPDGRNDLEDSISPFFPALQPQHGAVYRGQQFSYAQEWREYSIGDLLQLRQLEWLCSEGVQRYDMGMSDDPRMAYKTHWAECIRKQEIWLLLPNR